MVVVGCGGEGGCAGLEAFRRWLDEGEGMATYLGSKFLQLAGRDGLEESLVSVEV